MNHRQNLTPFSDLTQQQLLSLLETKALILLVTDNFNLLSKRHCLVPPIRVSKPVVNIGETERARKIEKYRCYAAQCADIISKLDEEHLSKAAVLNNAVITELIDARILGTLLTSGIPFNELDTAIRKCKLVR